MFACYYHNFDITISGETAPYAVTATYRGLRASGTFDQDSLRPVWQEYLAVLADLRRPPGEEYLVAVGTALFDALLRDDVRELWVQARADLDEVDSARLRLRLLLDPPAVASLPWESLYDPRRQQPFGADASIALVRVANQVGYVGRARPIEATLPLKILLAAVDDPGGIDVVQELARVESILAPLRPHKIDLQIISGRLDIHTVRRHLVQQRPDVFHLISHGQPDGLLLWGSDGQPALVSGSQIQATLRQVDALKLVFLNACLAGQPDGKLPFASVAHRLLQTHLPAVIAMQFEVPDNVAIEFAAFLYEALVAGDCPGAVDRAVGVARTNLYISDTNRVGYITPILWLNSEDGLIARFRQQDMGVQDSTEPTNAVSVTADVSTFVAPPLIDLDLAEKEQWFSRLPKTIDEIELPGEEERHMVRRLYAERRQSLARLLHQLQSYQQEWDTGQNVNSGIPKKLLPVFNEERRRLDDLLRRLHTPLA